MSTFCRRPFAGPAGEATRIDRLVDSAEAAVDVLRLAMTRPQRSEVIVVLLDEDFVGHTIIIVDGTESPDAVVDVIELLVEGAAEAERPTLLVVASIRPDLGPLPGDADRWLEIDELAERCGCELLEWFVVSGDVGWCPRDLLAEPPRWPIADP